MGKPTPIVFLICFYIDYFYFEKKIKGGNFPLYANYSFASAQDYLNFYISLLSHKYYTLDVAL